MESSRAHPFQIILVSVLCLVLGFLLGFVCVYLSANLRKNTKGNSGLPPGGDTIMLKRMQAIKAAQKSGKDEYEFEVSGPHPILNK